MFPISLISYYKKAYKTLSDHWDELFSQKPSGENPYAAETAAFQGELAILSEFEEWASEFQAFEYSAPFFFKGPEDFVVAVRDRCSPALTAYKHETAIEFSYLLPDKPDVHAVLPLLITGYVLGRRGDPGQKDGENKCFAVDESDPKYTANFLMNLLNGKDFKVHNDFKRSRHSLFRPAKKYTKLPKLQYSAMTNPKLAKSLSLFRTSMLFLFFAYKTRELCNLTLSCSLFMEFSESGSLLDEGFPNYENLLSTGELPAIEHDPLRDDILRYIKWAFDQEYKPLDGIAEEMLRYYTPLDLFLAALMSKILDREAETRRLTEDYLQRNEWAYDNIYKPYWEFCVANGRPLPIYDIDDTPINIDWEALDEWEHRKNT